MARRPRFAYYRNGAFRGRAYTAYAGRRGISGSYGKMDINMSPAFLIGAMVGFSNMDDKIPAEITLAAASMPVKGLGTVKAAAQGILMGNLIQSLSKNKGLSGRGSNFGM